MALIYNTPSALLNANTRKGIKMAIMKTTYGSTGHTSYEQVDSILDIGNRTIRVYSDDGVQERELSKGDRVELIGGTVCIHAEDCPDAGATGGPTAKQFDNHKKK